MTGYVHGVNTDGEPLRDVYVEHDASKFGIDCSADGMTRQEFKDECDINVLLDRYEKTGVINHFSRKEPMYMDLSEGAPDLMTAMDVLHRATDAFMTLPAKVRREFDNDPVRFVQFAEDKGNLPQLREWGLAPPAEPLGAVSPDPDPAPPPANGSSPAGP